MMMDLSLQDWFALAGSLLIASFLFKIYSASRSPLHVLPGPKRASLLLGELDPNMRFSILITFTRFRKLGGGYILEFREKHCRRMD